MGNLIARHRRNRLVRWWARRCQRFLDRYHNLSYDIDRNGERFVLERLAALGVLAEAPVFDVGANVGGWTLAVKALAPQATVHSFEIVPATFAALRERTAGLPGVVINDFGLGDREDSVVVRHFPAKPGLSSTVVGSGGGRTDFVEVAARIRRGDDYLAESGIAAVSLLKIDVEGAEPDVLAGFAGALAAGKVSAIQFEYGKVNISRRFLLKDFFGLLGGYGYRVGKIFPTYVEFRDYRLEDEDFRGPNFLAVRKEREDILSVMR